MLKIMTRGLLISSALLFGSCKSTASPFTGEFKSQYKKFEVKNDLPEAVSVFKIKDGNYPRYRIPNLIATPKGALIAVIEGRQGGDHSKNDIVIKRSEDGGKTWGSLKVIAEQGDDVLIDSNSIIDKSNGRIFIAFNKMAWGYHNAKAVPGYDSPHANRHYIMHSDDDGLTWSKLKEITRSVKPKGVTHAIIAPGARGVCLSVGTHKGRLVFPVYTLVKRGGKIVKRAYSVYSDDHGKTWKRGEFSEIDASSDPEGDCSEPHMTQLSDGTLLMNTRSPNRKKDKRFRRQAFSKDGGVTWSKMKYVKDLLDPRCCASLITVNHKGKELLLFANPYSTKGRVNGMVSVSFDGGKTWPKQKQLYAPKSGFSYSSMVQLPDGTIGNFFEADGCKAMKFTRFTIDWLLK